MRFKSTDMKKSTMQNTDKIWLRIVYIVIAVIIAVNAGIIIHYNIKWKNRPTIPAQIMSVYNKEDVGKKCGIMYIYEDIIYENEINYAFLSFVKVGKHINIKVNPDIPQDIHYTQYDINGLICIDLFSVALCSLFLWFIIKKRRNKNSTFLADDLDNSKTMWG